VILTLLLSIDEFSITNVDISNIKFDKTNPNQLVKEQIDALSKGMKKFGYLSPVILNKDMVVLDGEHRVKVYEKLGKKKIPAYVINVSKLDGKMLRQVMNKLHGEHDKTKDAHEFKLIFDGGKLDMFSKLIAQPKEEFEHIIEKKFQLDLGNEETEIPKRAETTNIKFGDIYQLGKHKIMCGDVFTHLSNFIDNVEIDMVFTDPPYSLGGYAGRSGKFKEVAGDRENPQKFYDIIPKNIPERYIWGNWFNIKSISETPRDVIIWHKNNFGMGRGYRNQYEICMYFGKFAGSDSDVWDVKKDNVSSYQHPTQKPTELGIRAIINSSEKNSKILDCFLGSGSTLMACEKTQRICYGMEIDPYYIDVVIQRWENYTHKKAVKIK